MREGYEKRVDMRARRQIAEAQLAGVRWISDVRGYCVCPGVGAHSQGNGKRDCRIEIAPAEVPTVHCFHSSCAPQVAEANRKLRSAIGKMECVRVSTPPGQRSGLRPYTLRPPVPFARKRTGEVRGVRVEDMIVGRVGRPEENTPALPARAGH